MANIDVKQIRKRNFEPRSDEEKIESYCIEFATTQTDRMLERYDDLANSRNGRYINSDLMKFIYPFYASSLENRVKYNEPITNSAACLTNERYRRAILSGKYEHCIFVAGPYGAGKSFFSQSLFESDSEGLLNDAILYEGSVVPPAFGEKVGFAIENGVKPEIIVLNPTFELSMRNIKERAKRIGRDVAKNEVVDKYSTMYDYIKLIVNQYPGISYRIYNKKSNADTFDMNDGIVNLEELKHGSREEISKRYDEVKEKLDLENFPEFF